MGRGRGRVLLGFLRFCAGRCIDQPGCWGYETGSRKKPFVPFRVHTTEGKHYDVWHPDQVLVLRSRLEFAVGGENGIPEHAEHVALRHVVRVEELPTEASQSSE